MPILLKQPSVVRAVGNIPKHFDEFVGHINSGDSNVSVARMCSFEGWCEPGQRPAFQEITLALDGMVRVEHEGGTIDVHAG